MPRQALGSPDFTIYFAQTRLCLFHTMLNLFSSASAWLEPISSRVRQWLPITSRRSKSDLASALHQKLTGTTQYSFHGGLHLGFGKELTNTSQLYQLAEVDYYLINLLQHKGPSPTPLVEEGQEVKAGQPLTSWYIPGELSVHAPVDGKVVAIQEYLYASPVTKTCPTLVLERKSAVQAAPVAGSAEATSTRDSSLPAGVSLVDPTNGTPIGPVAYQPLDYKTTPTIDLCWRIKHAGIAGLGGATFPSARKINARELKSVLINACECEPYITCDDVLMQHYAEQLVESFLCIQWVVNAEKVIVAIEDDKQAALQALSTALTQALGQRQAKLEQLLTQRWDALVSHLQTLTTSFKATKRELTPDFVKETLAHVGTNRSFDQQAMAALPPVAQLVLKFFSQDNLADNSFKENLDQGNNSNAEVSQLWQVCQEIAVLKNVHLRVVPAMYPTGYQRTTIEVLTGLRLPRNQNLTSLGAINFNIATVYSIYRAIVYGEALTQRLVTVTGSGIARPGNYWLSFGITAAHLLSKLGVAEGFTGQVIMGGPMMGLYLDDLNVPINKATNCLIFVGKDDVTNHPKLFAPAPEESCIRCTACQDVCPIELQPQMLYWHERAQDDQKLKDANLSQCIECGLCDYVCPSNIPLTNYFANAKHRIYQTRMKELAAEENRKRSEIKKARDEAARLAREAKREADKQKNAARAAQVRAAQTAATGVDPIAAAKARLAAKGVAVGKAVEVTPNATGVAGGDVPDNTSIMEQRRLRRLQREQAKLAQQQARPAEPSAPQAKAVPDAIPAEPDTAPKPLDKSAVLAAVAKAKATQAAAKAKLANSEPAQAEKSSTALESTAAQASPAGESSPASEATVEPVVAPATEPAVEPVSENTAPTAPKPLNKAAVLAAVAKAKAAQAAAKAKLAANASAASVQAESSAAQVLASAQDASVAPEASDLASDSVSAQTSKQTASTPAPASAAESHAETASVSQEAASQESSSQEPASQEPASQKAASEPKPLNKAAVLAAVAKAKAAQAARLQAQAQAQTEQTASSAQTASPTSSTSSPPSSASGADHD